MPKGIEILQWTLSATSTTHLPGQAGGLLLQINFEGTYTMAGRTSPLQGTATFTASRHAGTYGWLGFFIPDESTDGDGLLPTLSGTGTTEMLTPTRWRTRGTVLYPTGKRCLTEGEYDLETRLWQGKDFGLL